MTEFLTALLAVAAAEMGDKTQFIALVLAARYANQKWAIVIGLVAAAALMHGIAGTLGFFVGDLLNGKWVALIVGVIFIAMGMAILVSPNEKPDEATDVPKKYLHLGALGASFLLFSVSEIADKSQVATMMLAAHYDSILRVASGAAVGMTLVVLPVIFFGAWLTKKLPLNAIRYAGSGIFVIIGLLSLYEYFKG
ncbi:TMEM165/GDT1 family protein [Aliidiomarina halalkaliphila]|uniref:GDT1 family protein n=1 Tax=Aliidiomarina halalkaliphila TaxID=2593535 RepID=A0A552X5D1_9GAMM|nr:TMEM165/GDT1 family protein [Aliidiomarina halalkaliphila]TRW50224.1 TMEM165/GDT1 family protein [Aliidiomarina halalkaliphila]